jgi:hypothetical protein
MVDFGLFPLRVDPFTYAPVVPDFVNQPWLAQLLFLAADRLAGEAGVIFAHAVAITSAFAVLNWLLRRQGASAPVAAGLTLLGLLLASTSFNVRPQSFSFLLFVAYLALIRLPLPARLARPGIGIVAMIWANLHGSFTLMAPIAIAHTLGAILQYRDLRARCVRDVLWLSLITAGASLLNPFGFSVWTYAVGVGADPTNRQNIEEWAPVSPATLTGQLFLFTVPLIVLGLAAAWRWRARRFGWRMGVPIADVLLLMSLFGLALSMQRAVVWFGLAAVVALGGPPPEASRGRQHRHSDNTQPEIPALNLAVLVAIGGLMLLSLPWFRSVNPLLAPELRGLLSADHPTGAVAYLSEHLPPVQAGQAPPRLFARMEWGGYLAWELWPRVQVFSDARVEHHPPAVWREYFGILAARPGWQAQLDAYGADWLLVERQPFPDLVAAAEADPRWRRVFADDLGVLYARATPGA